jgi:hypothetical protein
MRARSPGANHRLAFTALAATLALLPLCSTVRAQSISMTLDDILIRLDGNLESYDAQVPSLFCDEHAISKMAAAPPPGSGSKKKAPPAPQTQTTVTESTFRLKRVATSETAFSLVESRDIKTVNGEPAQTQEITGPALLSGAFSSATAIASERLATCVHMTLEPIQPDKPTAPYVIDFATAPKTERPEGCVLKDDGSGRIYVDSDSMQITRIEFTAPHHPLSSQVEMSYGRPVRPPTGVWNITIDYAGVAFGRNVFWLPSTVTGVLSGGTVPTVWSFEAHYSNFHKLEVESHVVAPAPDSPQP